MFVFAGGLAERRCFWPALRSALICILIDGGAVGGCGAVPRFHSERGGSYVAGNLFVRAVYPCKWN